MRPWVLMGSFQGPASPDHSPARSRGPTHADDRLRGAADPARANPVALATIDRSAALLRGDRDRLPGLAEFFAAASCS